VSEKKIHTRRVTSPVCRGYEKPLRHPITTEPIDAVAAPAIKEDSKGT
jgi:hypothetical protein